jgi:hypothetical protein
MAAGCANPVIQLVDLSNGVVTPVPSALDGDGAFDASPVPRKGWIAVQVQYRIAAFRDWSLLRSVLLPEGWRMAPAADPELLWVDRYEGRSRDPDEGCPVVLVDSGGDIHRTAVIPGNLVGEVEAGLVFTRWVDRERGWGAELCTWDGEVVSLSPSGAAIGVLAADWVVCVTPDQVEMTSVSTGTTRSCPVQGLPSYRGVTYNAEGTRLSVATDVGTAVLADAEHGLRLVSPPEGYRMSGIPVGAEAMLAYERPELRWGLVDIGPGGLIPVNVRGRLSPRLDVSKRFDPEEVRKALRPDGWKPPSRSERSAALATLRASLLSSGVTGANEQAREAVRLRACLAPRRLRVGGSRFGGRPDLPPGVTWPVNNGTPMAFLGQLRLDELAAAAPDGTVPEQGLLSIFVGLEADGGWIADQSAVRVLVLSDEVLRRRSWPPALPLQLRFEPEVILPEPTLTWPTAFREAVIDPALAAAMHLQRPCHQFMGHPYAVQETIQTAFGEAQLSLLFQIDGDSMTGFVFGDGGRLHIWARASSDDRLNFDDITVTVDSF